MYNSWQQNLDPACPTVWKKKKREREREKEINALNNDNDVTITNLLEVK